jgi:hypothetical protein
MIVQGVISTAKPGAGRGEFRKLANQMLAWLKGQRGFLSYAQTPSWARPWSCDGWA